MSQAGGASWLPDLPNLKEGHIVALLFLWRLMLVELTLVDDGNLMALLLPALKMRWLRA